MSSIRNTVIVAIMQVGVIVAGVLASGLLRRMATADGLIIPTATRLLFNYGVIGLVIPLIWCSCAVALAIRPGVSDAVRVLMFWFGILVLVALACFLLYANVCPFFSTTWNLREEWN